MVRSLDRSPSRRPAVCSSRRGSGDAGFTLVEVLVAMAIMTVGLLAVAQLLAVSAQTHLLGRQTSEASILATSKLEELVKLNFNTAPAVQISGAPDPLTQNVANYFDQPAGGYTRRWSVAAGPTPDTRLVTLRVIPRSVGRASRVVEVTTILRQW